MQLLILEDKSHKRLRLGQKIPKMEDMLYRVRENINDPINPYENCQYFRSVCPPEQKRFFCRQQSHALKHTRRVHRNKLGVKDPLPFLSNPNQVIGPGTIGKCMKQIAQICEFDNWQKCTNHGNRAYAVTILINGTENKLKGKEVLNHCRHNSVHSQLPYNCRNPVAESRLQNALSAVSAGISKDNPKIGEGLNNTYIPEKSSVEGKINSTPIISDTATVTVSTISSDINEGKIIKKIRLECKELANENKDLQKKLDHALFQIDLIQKKIDNDDVLKKNVENDNDNNHCIIM